MRYTLFEKQKNEIILLARILLMILFVMSGWSKLTGFSGTAGYLESLGVPVPMLATAIAVIIEFLVAILILVGFYTRPLAFLFALFVLGTAVIGHDFWTMADAERATNVTQFFKNLSIIGGLLLLGLTGPGKYSVDGR
ncbi:DoxX family protein [Pseudomonas sp. gcc21]|uniref:DoxX family protein n=1 Tax=Pseudomonas sp. gcc21 TaxID=2726989 RepID=UPI0014526968|nr:DoxX family protein [Pseudomonas sp. gcc21]QJD59813.1 DoxX family protein [Pseudomonas sp. gcc21]